MNSSKQLIINKTNPKKIALSSKYDGKFKITELELVDSNPRAPTACASDFNATFTYLLKRKTITLEMCGSQKRKKCLFGINFRSKVSRLILLILMAQ